MPGPAGKGPRQGFVDGRCRRRVAADSGLWGHQSNRLHRQVGVEGRCPRCGRAEGSKRDRSTSPTTRLLRWSPMCPASAEAAPQALVAAQASRQPSIQPADHGSRGPSGDWNHRPPLSPPVASPSSWADPAGLTPVTRSPRAPRCRIAPQRRCGSDPSAVALPRPPQAQTCLEDAATPI